MSNIKSEIFITITGMQHYYGLRPFVIGSVVQLVKEPDNEHDAEAIAVALPLIGKIGYVANSPRTVARGTYSAGRAYDRFARTCLAQVLFATHDSIIARLLPGVSVHWDIKEMRETEDTLFPSEDEQS